MTHEEIVEETMEDISEHIYTEPMSLGQVHDYEKTRWVEAITTIAQRVEETTSARERLRAFEILHTYAMKTKNTHALDLIEQAQKDILSTLNK